VCGSCDGEISLSFALMVAGGKKYAVPSLSICQHCGMVLLGPPVDQTQYFEVANCAEKVWGVSRFLLDEPAELLSSLERAQGPPAFHLAGATFESDGSTTSRSNQKRKAWSREIPRARVSERRKLAYALTLVRKELQATGRIDTPKEYK
jgi:hypothetical protein